MQNIETSHQLKYSLQKRTVIIIFFILLVVTSLLPIVLGENSSQLKVIDFITIIGYNFLVFAWCHYDSLERNQSLGAGWRLLIIILGVLAFIIYLLKSRGFKLGLIALGKALLIFLGMVVGSTIIATIVGLITGKI